MAPGRWPGDGEVALTKNIKIQGSAVVFPPTCVVCLLPAPHRYTIDKTITLGQKTYTVSLQAPMCSLHYGQTQAKSAAERLFERAGVILGGGVGALVWVGLLLYWNSIEEPLSMVNILIAAVVGAGFFLVVWASTAFWLAPNFAMAESKEARNAVRVVRYWKAQDIVELEFRNDLAADRVAWENPGRVIL